MGGTGKAEGLPVGGYNQQRITRKNAPQEAKTLQPQQCP
jgi:hypothetical protein